MEEIRIESIVSRLFSSALAAHCTKGKNSISRLLPPRTIFRLVKVFPARVDSPPINRRDQSQRSGIVTATKGERSQHRKTRRPLSGMISFVERSTATANCFQVHWILSSARGAAAVAPFPRKRVFSLVLSPAVRQTFTAAERISRSERLQLNLILNYN